MAVLIIIGGMIGLGKSSVAKLLSTHFKTKVFYESVENNPILPLFYTATDEEIEMKRYPFLLQLYFLEDKIKSMRQAVKEELAILDRSIYEDWYFAKINKELGRISALEFQLYERLFYSMKEEVESKAPCQKDLVIYLQGSFETVISRIMQRGRSYELDEHLKSYYFKLWQEYDRLITSCYEPHQILIVNMDKIDMVNNEEHARQLILRVENKLSEMHHKIK